MKKVLLIALLALLPITAFAANEFFYVGEKNTTVNATTGALVTIDYDGYVNVFAHAKTYITLDPAGVTPNTSSKYLIAGGSLSTETFYTRNQKIGLLSDSGTASINITVHAAKYAR